MFLGINETIIKFSRDSVCMADDMNDNRKEVEFDLNDSWERLLEKVKENHFLASVSGNNVVWVLNDYEGNEILSYFTSADTIIKCTTKMTIGEICKKSAELHFKYYTSPLKRGQYIFNLYKGDMYGMYHDGWIEEYKQCMVPKAMENEWKKNIGRK